MSEPPERTTVAAPPVSRWALVPAGQPYHLLARNSAHTWWRPLAALVLVAVLEVVSVIAATVVLMGMVLFPPDLAPLHAAQYIRHPETVNAILTSPLVLLVLGFALIIALLPPLILVARWVQKRPASSLVSVTGGVRWRWLGECLATAVAVFAVAFGVMVTSDLIMGVPEGTGFPGWADYARIVLIAVLIVPLQSATEEFVFRGFLLQTFTAWFRTPWPGMVVCSLLFLAGHGYTDPVVWAELFLMAMTMSWLAIRTGGLEAAIGLHTANNALTLVVAGTSGVPDLEQAGEFPLMQVLPLAVATVAYAWIADWRAARRGLATVVGGRTRIAPLSLRPTTPR